MAPVLYSAPMMFECRGGYMIEEEDDLFQLIRGHEVP